MIPEPLRDEIRQVESDRKIAAELIAESDLIYVIFKSYPILGAKYDRRATDVMIMATVEYPKTALDMFFTPTDIRRVDGEMPEATSVVTHMGAEWLQWSIHPYRQYPWDPARDDLPGFLLYVDQRFRNGD